MNFFIKSFGCQINNLDFCKIKIILKKNFFKLNYIIFDIIVINTCSVREFCQKKIFFFLKNNFLDFLVILNGCSSNLFYIILIKKKYINLIINSHSIYFLNYLIFNNYFYNCKQIFFQVFNFKNLLTKKILNILLVNGCNKYCAYCIIPYTRGREIYEDFFFVLKKIILNNKNFKELFFLGQNINSYKFFYNKKILNFYVFLKILFNFYLNYFINYITLNFKNIIKNYVFYKNLNYIHIPIQTASNYLLLITKRNYSFNIYKKFFYFLKKNFWDFLISTDIITNFPQESWIFFNKTFISIEKLLFDKSYIFIYNSRSFTSFIFIFNNINFILKKNRFLKIWFKLKNNIIYIKNFFLNKFYLINLKFFCLNFNNLFFSFLNNRLIFFFLNLIYIKINIFLKLKFLKILKKKIFLNKI